MSDSKQAPRSRANASMFLRLLVVVGAMFAFGFALIPLYRVFCTVTGIGLLTQAGESARLAKNTQVDTSRVVRIEFDSNGRGALHFRPVQHSMTVHPGELSTIEYEIVNMRDKKTVGQAIPSYAPLQSAAHFHKVQCFCFSQQTMGPNEKRRFPVVFFVDPKLPKDVNTITLSYTFFEVEGADVKPAPAAAAPDVDSRRS